jgi:CDP-diacylglycerol---serine O-phosphatidyltransferase
MMPPRAVADRPRARGLRRGAYLLPSLFTIGNMLLGFYAVVCGLNGQFRKGALLVFIAAIIDSLDGRLARMTGTESDFGKEYDSLADVITFGAAPALLTYLWGVKELAREAWLIPVFFMVCTATRLARFNVQTRIVDSRFFVGLPAPAAAGAICSLLFFAPYYTDDLRVVMQVLVATALLLIGALMVSTFRYSSFKKFDLRKRWSYRAAVPFAAIVLVIVFIPRATFLAIAVLYTLSGPLGALITRLRPGPRPGGDIPPVPPTEEPQGDYLP